MKSEWEIKNTKLAESTFSASLVKALREKGLFVQRIESTVGNGIPDIYCCNEGRTIWLELKSSGTETVHVRPEQYNWHMDYKKHLGTVLVVAKTPKRYLIGDISGAIIGAKSWKITNIISEHNTVKELVQCIKYLCFPP